MRAGPGTTFGGRTRQPTRSQWTGTPFGSLWKNFPMPTAAHPPQQAQDPHQPPGTKAPPPPMPQEPEQQPIRRSRALSSERTAGFSERTREVGCTSRSRLCKPNCPRRPGRPPSPGSALHGVQHLGPAVCCGPSGAFLYHQPSAGTVTAGPSPGSPHHASHCPRADRRPRRPAPGRLHS